MKLNSIIEGKNHLWNVFFLAIWANTLNGQSKLERLDVFAAPTFYMLSNKDVSNLKQPSLSTTFRIFFKASKRLYIGAEFRNQINYIDSVDIFKNLTWPNDVTEDFQMSFNSTGLGLILRSTEFEISKKLRFEIGVGLGFEFHSFNEISFTFFPYDPLSSGFESEDVNLRAKPNYNNSGFYASVIGGLHRRIAKTGGKNIDLIVNGSFYYSQFSIYSLYTSDRNNRPIEYYEYTTEYKSLVFNLEIGIGIYW